jgi:hypothetical protein
MQAWRQSNVQAIKFSVLLLLCLLTPLLLVWLIPTPQPIYTLWDWANVMGYMVLTLALLLFVYRGRARSFPAFSGRFFANLHRDLGYIAMLLLTGHVGLLLWAEPLLLEHLKPSAPLHMLAGLFALLFMIVLVISSVPFLRRRLWPNYHRFRHIHALFAAAILGLVNYHVVMSGFYLNSEWKLAVLAVVGSYVATSAIRRERTVLLSGIIRIRNSASYSHMITYCVTLLVLLASLLALLLQQTE